MTDRAVLSCHPAIPTDAVRGIDVTVVRQRALLTLTFRLDADRERIRIPPPRPTAIVHQLWEHTCFELFAALENASAYHELNLAPSGEWAGYQFRAYREIDAILDDTCAPRIAVRPSGERFELEASIALARLSPAYADAPLCLGLSAVIEELSGRRSYWALAHPAAQPDFHHRDARALRLEPPAREC
jgi:hypothetical protein